MRKIDLRLRLFISFVILAILAMTLVPMPSMMPMLRPATSTTAMPAMAMAMARAGPAAMADLCSASAAPRSSSASHAGGHMPADCDGMPMHCMFCSSAVHPVTPTISAAVLLLLLSFGSAYLPALFEHGPRTLFVWAPSQARAPPAPLHG